MAKSHEKSAFKIRILHLITTLDLGGAETQLFRLLEAGDKDQFQYSVVSLTSMGVFGGRIKSLGIPVYALGMKRGVPSLLAIWDFWRILQKEKPLIIQTWMYHADLLGVLWKVIRGGHLVWNIRCSNLDMRNYRRLTSWLAKVLNKLSTIPDAVIANSLAGKQVHQQKGYQPKLWRVIPNGLDLNVCCPSSTARNWLRSELNLPQNSLLIGLIARYDPMKDHETFLVAAGLLHENYPHIHFVLCGKNVDWCNLILCELVRRHSLETVVHLLGQREDVIRVTSALDISCSTSSFGEGFSNAIGEAMACGVVCVATRVGDSSEIIGECGRIVPPKNPEAIMKAWSELIDLSMTDRQVLGSNARERIAQKFDIMTAVDQYEGLYAMLIRNDEPLITE